jgi:hypothetical protein
MVLGSYDGMAETRLVVFMKSLQHGVRREEGSPQCQGYLLNCDVRKIR